ncbi:MAG TPA: Tm-1-like ATP-binding domain-containing protein [Opitutaceae bacterium]|nr:Tm-1-like ATP-binding domain-containing protein [Opitutaceae bacterium]
MPTIAVLGTFDTKGPEHAFLAEQIRHQGFTTLLIDVATLEHTGLSADIGTAEIAAQSGVADWKSVLAKKDRGASVALMAAGAARVLADLVSSGRIQGVISMGGGGGTAIGSAAMRGLPLGFPKVMVTTLASGHTAPYIGTSDLVLFPAVVDVAGLNRISRLTFENAAGAICGMVRAAEARRGTPPAGKPIVVASMFGNTTICINEAKRLIEAAGYEVLVYHATGTGGRNMEALISSGLVSGVLDLTTTEWADELVGGILTAGPTRLDAAARAGIPTLIAPGCLDMVNFGEPQTVPARFSGRRFYQHNPQVTLMRTDAKESAELGRILAEKANTYRGPVRIFFPKKGLSVIGEAGQPFHDVEADAALLAGIRRHLRSDIPLLEQDTTINDLAFARICAESLLHMLEAARQR